jgi:hypothetical protein
VLLSFKSRRVRAVRWAIGLMVSPLLMLLLSPVTATRAAYAAAGPRSAGDGLTRTEVSFRGGDGVILHGAVVAPSRIAGRVPGIVLVGCSGPGPRQEYTQEAEAFARGGVATLVYDKRTTGYSKMHRDFSLLAADALAGVRTLRARPGVDPAKVGLWGFSEGGWVAPLAASRSSDVVGQARAGSAGEDRCSRAGGVQQSVPIRTSKDPCAAAHRPTGPADHRPIHNPVGSNRPRPALWPASSSHAGSCRSVRHSKQPADHTHFCYSALPNIEPLVRPRGVWMPHRERPQVARPGLGERTLSSALAQLRSEQHACVPLGSSPRLERHRPDRVR